MSEFVLHAGDALLIVDVQNDFLPGGSLAVPEGDAVIAPLNRCIEAFCRNKLPVYASRDWHPANHCSFLAQGGPWPVHCVAGSHGAGFAAGLVLPPNVAIIPKATTPEQEAYSVFAGTDLDQRLKGEGVRRLFVGGLATDYCVLKTVKDALALCYTVVVLRHAVRAVDATPGDGTRALAVMRHLGAYLSESECRDEKH